STARRYDAQCPYVTEADLARPARRLPWHAAAGAGWAGALAVGVSARRGGLVGSGGVCCHDRGREGGGAPMCRAFAESARNGRYLLRRVARHVAGFAAVAEARRLSSRAGGERRRSAPGRRKAQWPSGTGGIPPRRARRDSL